MQKNRGFSLMELLLTVAVLGVIAGFSTPLYLGLQVRNELDSATNTAAQVIRRSQALAQSSAGDRRWGTRVTTGTIILYRTVTNFAGRDTTFDENFSIPTNITVGGTANNEVNFSISQALPLDSSGVAFSADKTITLSSSMNETRTLTISPKGIIIF